MATGIEKVSATLTAAVTLTPNGTADNTTLPEQPGRKCWGIKASPANTGTIYFAFGATADATNGIPLSAGQGYTEPVAGNAVWDGMVSVFAATGSDKATVWSY